MIHSSYSWAFKCENNGDFTRVRIKNLQTIKSPIEEMKS